MYKDLIFQIFIKIIFLNVLFNHSINLLIQDCEPFPWWHGPVWGAICASPNFDILGVKFDSRLTFEEHAAGVSLVSLKEFVF